MSNRSNDQPNFVVYAGDNVASFGVYVFGGIFRGASGIVPIASGRVPVTDNATNYVYIDAIANSIAVSTTGYPGHGIPLATVTLSSGVVTSTSDDRTFGFDLDVLDRPDRIASAVPGKPSTGQIVAIYTAAFSVIFPANFATPNSYGSVGTNPTATATYTVYKNGSSIGTIAISTSGVFTFTTAGFTLNAGDRLTIVAPGSQDATLADVGMTLVGTRSAIVPAGAAPPIFTWRGTYSGATAYSPFDVVAYAVSGKVQSYACILATTGNAPTNTTYWNLLAQAGADGTTTASQIQQQAFIYAVDTGAANAYSVTLSPAPNVVDGSVVVFRAANANATASTLTLPGDTGATGATAKSIVKQGGTALSAGDIPANGEVVAVWDNSHTRWVAIGLGGGGDTTAKYLIGATDATLSNAIVWPGITTSPDVPPTSAGSLDDEFDSALSGWTTLNSPTTNVSNSILSLRASAHSGTLFKAVYKNAPGSTPWIIKAKVALSAGPTNYSASGLFLYDGSNKFLQFGQAYNGGFVLNRQGYNNPTTYGGLGTNLPGYPTNWIYIAVKNDGTNLIFYVSMDGIGTPGGTGNWLQVQSDTIASFVGSVSKVGLCINSETTSYDAILHCDWFRSQ